MKKLVCFILLLAMITSLFTACKTDDTTTVTDLATSIAIETTEPIKTTQTADTTQAAETTKSPDETTAPPETVEPIDPFEPLVYSVVPDIVWAYATRENTMMTFTMGNGVYEFGFSAVDISEMQYLEFDIYIPSMTNYAKITEDTQFEITSSGTCDKNEHAWTGHQNGILKDQNIQEGWNHVKIALSEMPTVDKTSVNYIRWYWVSPRSTVKDCAIANLRFTTDSSVDPVSEKKTVNGFIVDTVYPTTDVVIATVDVTKAPYCADNTGKTDVTAIINKALKDVSAAGGGTVFMPIGQYLITGSVTIPAYCTLRGDWQDPDIGTDYGTVILAKPQKTTAVNDALFMIGGSAGVNGLTVYYPEQNINDIKEYPFTFYTTGRGSA